MKILDYLQSDNIENQSAGLRKLGVDENLIKEFNLPINDFKRKLLSDFMLGLELKLIEDWLYHILLYKIINQIAEYEIVSKDKDSITITFIKLKEVTYD